MHEYWFFLSYARRDAMGDKYIERFFNDLAKEVARIAGLPSKIGQKEVGFWDNTGLEPGDCWSDTLAASLQTSRVLICLYSRGYFNSEYCGKELSVFLSRLEKYQLDSSNNTHPPLILPILWDRPDRLPQIMPAAVADIQYSHNHFGDLYEQEGLLYLMRLQKHRDKYKTFVYRFAEKLFNVAETFSLPSLENMPSLLEVESAFHTQAAQHSAVQEKRDISPEVVQFVFAAGRINELALVRKDTRYYGTQGGRDWRPYLPDVDITVGVISQRIATAENLFYENVPLCENLIQQIRDAEKTNTIVIILVDSWSIQIEGYKRHMLEYDGYSFANSRVLIPWNDKDNETQKNQSTLRATIEAIFRRNLVLNDTYFQDSICTVEELEKEIIAAISEARRRLLRMADVQRPIENSINNPMPMIDGPGGTQ